MQSFSQSSGGGRFSATGRTDGAPAGHRPWHLAGADEHAEPRVLTPRVLVVDDDVDSAAALGAYLESLNCDVEIAHDGYTALAAARKLRPSAIFLDIGMPGLDGDEVCRRMRREPWGKHVVIAAATAFATVQQRERSFRAGFDHYLVKPLDLSNVRHLIGNLRDQNEQGDQT